MQLRDPDAAAMLAVMRDRHHPILLRLMRTKRRHSALAWPSSEGFAR